jgi:hypothetical protein
MTNGEATARALPDSPGEGRARVKFFMYPSDDGDVLRMRYRHWKVVFMERRCHGTVQIWEQTRSVGQAPQAARNGTARLTTLEPISSTPTTCSTVKMQTGEEVFAYAPGQFWHSQSAFGSEDERHDRRGRDHL